MFKALIFATVATLSLAQDYPKPVVPNNFVAESIHYTYANNRLTPTGAWSSQKWSSKLNKIYDAQGSLDDEGDEVLDNAEVTDATAKTSVSWKTGDAKCQSAANIPVEDVSVQISHYFDGFVYAGVQYAPWELTRVKYHRLDGQGIQYFYKQSNQMLRFIVWPSDSTTYVWDFTDGLVETDLAEKDFVIIGCMAAAEPTVESLIAKLLLQ